MSTAITIKTETTFVTLDCCTCGVWFAITEDHEKNLRRDHSWFYCPNGHQQHYSQKSDRDRANEAERKTASAIEDARIARLDAEKARRELAKVQAESKRTDRRVSNGVCPCCNRSFVQLARHMKAKHPEHAS